MPFFPSYISLYFLILTIDDGTTSYRLLVLAPYRLVKLRIVSLRVVLR